MTAPVACTADVDGIPISALFSEVPHPRATIVAIHGGATTSEYFDCPGHPELSLLRLGATLGYSVVALDRPGFGSSAEHDDEMTEPDFRTELTYRALDGILDSRPVGSGLFLVAHSAGSELALRMATHARGSRLLGLEIAGTGVRHQPDAREILRRKDIRDMRRGLRELMGRTAHLYPSDVMANISIGSWSPVYEASVVMNWQKRDFPALAAGVTVPVRFSLADHEPLWEAGEAGLTEVAALFTASPRVVVNEQRDSAHNLSLAFSAHAYHRGILSFVEQCITAREIGFEAS
jgi:pimeloyl-ACP methyl ester carboxylesterase